jgi:triacylglycerol esterase/lipase EstA (alpha/beta hydrolase family)
VSDVEQTAGQVLLHRLSAITRASFVLLACLAALPGAGEDARPPPELSESGEALESVVLLHGLWRSDWSMRRLEGRLQEAGFEVYNIDYASNRRTPGELVEHLREEVTRCCEQAAKLHFVTHSLGGIVTRAFLAEHRPASLGRVVMLAPPNQGSEYIDEFGEGFGWVLGPTGKQLGTAPDSLPNRLPPPDFEVGVIAGTTSHNPISGLVIDGENDGTVSVESTQLPGMADFIKLATTHTVIMRSDDAITQTLHFLRHGRFEHTPLP